MHKMEASLLQRLERGLAEVMGNEHTFILSESMPIEHMPEFMCLWGDYLKSCTVDIRPSETGDGSYYLWVSKNGGKHA